MSLGSDWAVPPPAGCLRQSSSVVWVGDRLVEGRKEGKMVCDLDGGAGVQRMEIVEGTVWPGGW